MSPNKDIGLLFSVLFSFLLAERQLSDSNFYQRVDHHLTTKHHNRVISVVQDAITKGELPATATNLIVDYPRTSRSYLLPKIHKPGNPGRPIVSACNCPTELLATYLDFSYGAWVSQLRQGHQSYARHCAVFSLPPLPLSRSNYFVFTMDIKSLYTVIPNNDGLVPLQYFLNKRSVLEPPTQT